MMAATIQRDQASAAGEYAHRQFADDGVAGPDGHAGEGKQEGKWHRYIQKKQRVFLAAV